MAWLETVIGKWVVKNRWWILVVTAATVIITTMGVQFLTFNSDSRVFFSEDNPQLKALETLENTYNRVDNVFFVIAPKNGKVFTRETLRVVEEMTEAAWQMPYSNRVDSISNFQYARAEADDLIVEDLVRDPSELSDAGLDRIKKTALSEPQLINLLISPSGDVTGIDVNILLPGKANTEVNETGAAARKMVEDFGRKYPNVDLYVTGGIMFDNAFGEAGRKDMSTLVPIMIIVLVCITGIALKSFVGTFSTLAVILMSMSTGMGLAGWLRISMTAASSNAPTIILTLAIADSVHILVTAFHNMRLGKSKHEAISESLRINLQPVFLTSFTTAIGFLTMNFSDAPPFRDLGNIVAIGVMMAFFYSIFFLPALIAVLPLRIKANPEEDNCMHCNRLATFVIKRRRQILIFAVVIVATMTTGIMRIKLGDDWIKYFGKSFDIRRATDFTEENLTGFHIIEYSLKSGEPGGINEPAYLNTVENFANWYRKQKKVLNVNTITNTMKRLNKNMHGDDEAYYRIPKSRNLAAQYLLLYEMSLPFGLDLNSRINIDKSASRMIVTLKDTTTEELQEMDKKARGWLKTNAPSEMFTYGSGLSIIWAHISERNIKRMLGGAFWALILISATMIIALRDLKLGLLSLVPNLIPALIAFGLWGICVGRVGLGLSVIAAMTLGIVVDDTVHFMSKYLRARREHDMDPAGAVRFSFNTVGTAMWVTTVALVAGFMVLAFSNFKMNADMGLLSSITIILALVMDFFLLPALLMKVEGQR